MENENFSVEKDMHPNIVEILPLIKTKGKETIFDFDTLERLTSKEFTDVIRKEFEESKDRSAFTCEVKKVTRSHRTSNYCDDIYVLIGSFIATCIYSYCINFPKKYNWEQDRLILNHTYYMEVIEPFMKQVDKKIYWKKRK
jgi:hypothetical protein